MGAHSCFGRLQGSSHPSPGCTASQWLGNTPGFFLSWLHMPRKHPLERSFSPPQPQGQPVPPSALCSPAITDLHWDRPHADPQFWQHRQHLWFPWQLQNAKYGAGARHSITSFPWFFQEVGSMSWSCPQDPGCRTLHGQTQLQGLYFRTTVQEGNSSTPQRSTRGYF